MSYEEGSKEHEKAGADRAVDLLARNGQLQAENERLEASNNALKRIWAGQICPKCGTVFRYQSSTDEIINTDLRANRVTIG